MADTSTVCGALLTGVPLKNKKNECYFSDNLINELSCHWGGSCSIGTIVDNHFPQDTLLIVDSNKPSDCKVHVNEYRRHAEEVMMDDNHELKEICTIYMNYTPCKCCATKMIESFKDIEYKPDIKVLWLYKYYKRDFLQSVEAVKDLMKDGFTITPWSLHEEWIPVLNTYCTPGDVWDILREPHDAFQWRYKLMTDVLKSIEVSESMDEKKLLAYLSKHN